MFFEYFSLVLEQAQEAFFHDEVPVGCVIIKEGMVIAKNHNRVLLNKDPIAHAEILAIQQAALFLKTPYLSQCTLYVTLEPCPMCAAAITLARIPFVFFGAYDPKGGGVDHGPRVFNNALFKPFYAGGIEETKCSTLMKEFFIQQRLKAKPPFSCAVPG